MILFTPVISPRLTYITGFIGNAIAGEPIVLTTDETTFRNAGGGHINYSDARITPTEIWLPPHPLLFENDIKKQLIEMTTAGELPAFFHTGGDFPFDIFAASFYLLSRYEEYLPHDTDEYGRYAHEQSIAWRENFINKPLVNCWMNYFKEVLRQRFGHATPLLPDTGIRFLPTYDIDEAFSYRHKDRLRSAGGVLKALVKGNWDRVMERRKVLGGKLQDPFDSYDWMDALHAQYDLHPHYFFLLAARTGDYDRNILPSEKGLQELVKQHDEKYSIGIHPSWQSGDNTSLIRQEIDTLSQITGKHITASRQHYIRFAMPRTFRHLIEAGITDDYSMGYGSVNGFRASVAGSFYWYDLEKDEATGLLLHPFCYMDANSFFEQKLTPAEALEEMRLYYQEVKAVNGTLITLWHNTFLGTDRVFAGWREVYRQFVDEISTATGY